MADISLLFVYVDALHPSQHFFLIFVLMFGPFPVCSVEPGPEVMKLCSCSTQLSTKFILLINVKIPTNSWHFNIISMMNTTFERLKFIYRYFSFYEQLKFCDQLS